MVEYPTSLNEALNELNKNKYTIYAGGTDLMVKKRNWANLPLKTDNPLMFISHLKELNTISESEKLYHIPACVTQTQMIESEILPDIFKIVVKEMSSPAIRNVATIGGNIVNSSPAGDLLPLLYVYDAALILKSINGEREIPIENFITGPGKNILKDNEILKEILIPKIRFNNNYYKKVASRKANALSKVAFIMCLNVEGKVITDFRIAFGAVAPMVIRTRNIEKDYIEKPKDLLKIKSEEIWEKYKEFVSPINDQRSTANYRERVVKNLIEYYLGSL